MKLREKLYFYPGKSGMKIRRGCGNCNCIVIGHQKLVLIDPGVSITKCFSFLKKRLTQDGLNIAHIQLMMFTHVHFDHANAAGLVQNESNCLIRTHPSDVMAVENPLTEYERTILPIMNNDEFPKVPLSLARFFTNIVVGERFPAKTGHVLGNHEKIVHDGLTIEIIFTPGHTTGHIAYYIPEYKALIGGDTIVREHEDRINAGGCINNMTSSLEDILITIDLLKSYDIELYIPGHGNPLEGKNAIQDFFARHMKSTIDKFDRVLSFINHDGIKLKELVRCIYPRLPFTYNQIKKIELFLFLQLLCQQKRINCIEAPSGRRYTPISNVNP